MAKVTAIAVSMILLAGCASMEDQQCSKHRGVTRCIPKCAKVVTIDGKQYVDRSGCSSYKPNREPREPRAGRE